MKDRIVLNGTGTHYFLADREVSEESYRAVYPLPPTGTGSFSGCNASCWPLVSTALAVHPDQVKEATLDAVRKGVPTDFQKDGRPRFTDRAHRAAYCRAYGFYDRDAGYSDAQRGGFRG